MLSNVYKISDLSLRKSLEWENTNICSNQKKTIQNAMNQTSLKHCKTFQEEEQKQTTA